MPCFPQNSAFQQFSAVDRPASIASCPPWARFTVARPGQKRDPGLKAAGNPANVGLNWNPVNVGQKTSWIEPVYREVCGGSGYLDGGIS
jgi:hypothetical protein